MNDIRLERLRADNTRLRTENDRLRSALQDLLSWFPGQPTPSQWVLKAGEYGADDAIDAARNALGGEP